MSSRVNIFLNSFYRDPFKSIFGSCVEFQIYPDTGHGAHGPLHPDQCDDSNLSGDQFHHISGPTHHSHHINCHQQQVASLSGPPQDCHHINCHQQQVASYISSCIYLVPLSIVIISTVTNSR